MANNIKYDPLWRYDLSGKRYPPNLSSTLHIMKFCARNKHLGELVIRTHKLALEIRNICLDYGLWDTQRWAAPLKINSELHSLMQQTCNLLMDSCIFHWLDSTCCTSEHVDTNIENEIEEYTTKNYICISTERNGNGCSFIFISPIKLLECSLSLIDAEKHLITNGKRILNNIKSTKLAKERARQSSISAYNLICVDEVYQIINNNINKSIKAVISEVYRNFTTIKKSKLTDSSIRKALYEIIKDEKYKYSKQNN